MVVIVFCDADPSTFRFCSSIETFGSLLHQRPDAVRRQWRQHGSVLVVAGKNVELTAKGVQKDNERKLSRILRTEAAVRAVERKAGLSRSTRLWPKAVLEALTQSINNNQWESALRIFGLLRMQHWYTPNPEHGDSFLETRCHCKTSELKIDRSTNVVSLSKEPLLLLHTSQYKLSRTLRSYCITLMAFFWILLLRILAIGWAVSWLMVLFVSYSNFRATFHLKRGDQRVTQARKVLLVIAHPDDESMFFVPTILNLNLAHHIVHILCISTGDAEGKGTLRKDELQRACVILKVHLQRVKIIDHPDLQDGFRKSWNSSLLKNIIEEALVTWDIDTLITFDNYGISGHRNHRDVHHGLCTLLKGNLRREIEAWELVSTNIVRKYCGPIDIWCSILESRRQQQEIYVLVNRDPHLTASAMAQHSSQWVWFRKLFVVLSRYTYINTLKRIRV